MRDEPVICLYSSSYLTGAFAAPLGVFNIAITRPFMLAANRFTRVGDVIPFDFEVVLCFE